MARPSNRRGLGAVGILTALLMSACPAPRGEPEPQLPSYGGSPVEVDDLRLPARVEDRHLALAIDGRFEPRFWPGVNLGASVPGHLPGEVATTREDYDRWLAGMDRLGVRAIRIYTILTPDFYEALARHNARHPDRPLYLIHGVWVPDEEEWIATNDAYDQQVSEGFRSEIEDAVAVVHGDADLPPRRGHAGGRYTRDVSRWVLAWALGIEWDPAAVRDTDTEHAGLDPYRGRYVSASAEATPMESWLASMLDHVSSLDAERGWSRPVTFTNWPSTDPLRHPEEPDRFQDFVSIDATHIRSEPSWPGGHFASYHVYPYWPDFLRLEPEYQEYRRARDDAVDPYAGYLSDLRAHHGDQAVMVTEFGVPSGLGIAHRGPEGRDQGGHAEEEAARMQVEMMRDIAEEGYAGAILFEWIDEWSKSTWNTQDLEVPFGRRQLWSNVLTNEQHFGVVATEPRGETPVVDGNTGEWSRDRSQVIGEFGRDVRMVRAAHDAAYLYLLVDFERAGWWSERKVTIGFDVVPGGNAGLPDTPGVYPEADVAVEIGPGDQARIRQAAWLDHVRIVYGAGLDLVPYDPDSIEEGSGFWVSPRLMLSRPLIVPSTDVEREAETADLGTMRWGTADPSDEDFDVRTLVAGGRTAVELRIPWALLSFSDPSSRTALIPKPDREHETVDVERVGIALVPEGSDPLVTKGYSWDIWNGVSWDERDKAGWDLLEEVFAAASAAPSTP